MNNIQCVLKSKINGILKKKKNRKKERERSDRNTIFTAMCFSKQGILVRNKSKLFSKIGNRWRYQAIWKRFIELPYIPEHKSIRI